LRGAGYVSSGTDDPELTGRVEQKMDFLGTLKSWIDEGLGSLRPVVKPDVSAHKPPKMPVFGPAEKQQILNGMEWFKQQFGAPIGQGLQNLPFTLDLLTAIAVQETFEVWGRLFNATPPKPVAEILFDCVGDTLDAADGRGTWPADKTALQAWPQGDEMFQIAHQALIDLAQVNPVYAPYAKNPNKFCHAYGIFQYDIQFFKTDPAYFLNKNWGDFALCLAKCIDELTRVWKRYYPAAATLSDQQLVFVAIAYNCGSVNTQGDFNQGYQDSDGVFYGQYINAFLDFAKSTSPAAIASR
jgi:hypothetical protein